MLLNRLSQRCHHPTLWDVSQRGLATHQLLSRRTRSERQVWLPSPWPVVQCHPQSPHVPAYHTLGQQHDHPLKASLGGAAAQPSHYFTCRIEKKPAPSCCHHHSNNNNNNDDDDVSQQEGPWCSVGMTCLRRREPWSLWAQASLCLQELGVTVWPRFISQYAHLAYDLEEERVSLKLMKYRLSISFCTTKCQGCPVLATGDKGEFCSGWLCVLKHHCFIQIWKLKQRWQKQHQCVLGLGLGEYLHGWRIICRVCVFAVLQAQHLIRDWWLITSKYKVVNLKQIDKKIMR